MKEIKAVIQPHRLEGVRAAFRKMHGFPGMTVTRVEGCSQHAGEEIHRDIIEELTDYSPKLRIEIVAPDDKADEIVALIQAHAYSGRRGDGIIWVTEVGEFRQIRLAEGQKPGT